MRNFALSEYRDSTGRRLHMYEMTRDGFTFLAMGFTDKKAAKLKMDYIRAFDRMEAFIMEQQKPRAVPNLNDPATLRSRQLEYNERIE
jgi:Rha family phage regulatory protein